MPQEQKMVNLAITETSGVDHPAHLREGWMVVKAASTAEVLDALDALTTEPDADAPQAEATGEKEGTMPEQDTAAVTEETTVEEFLKAAPSAVAKMIEDLQKSRDEAVAKATEAAEAAEAAAEDLRKEREAKATAAAIEKARTDYGDLGVDVEVVAPALMALKAVNADAVEAIETALKAAVAQADTGDLFEEVGKAAPKVPGDGSAFAKVEALAKARVSDGKSPTFADAMVAVAQENPALYTDYLNEKGA